MIETLEPAGLGALMALVEERKKKLAAEGLFDPARKQLLPFLPSVIGVITSPTGAVIRDILHRLADRFPRRVLVWPVKVQGEGSAEQVAAAIHGFNALAPDGRIPRPDLLIVARGGGSLEDLWSFNEEIVVRAAAESMIPLISAVGHETDVTLIDFAADVRAPTPTAAAEMAVPVRAELMVRIDSLARRSLACWQRGQEARRTELRAAARALPGADELLALPRQRLDHADRAAAARADRQYADRPGQVLAASPGGIAPRLLSTHRGTAARAPRRPAARGSRPRCKTYRDTRLVAHRAPARAAERVRRARRCARSRTCSTTATCAAERAGQLLTAFSYRGVLERGFALVRDLDGSPLRRAAAVQAGQGLDIEFADGRVRGDRGRRALRWRRVGAAAAAPAAPRRRRRRPGQPVLSREHAPERRAYRLCTLSTIVSTDGNG